MTTGTYIKIKTRHLTTKEIGEFDSRDFHTDEAWKRMKNNLDELLAFRKTIKQKPTEYERWLLDTNQFWIDHYNTTLFHSARLAMSNRCDCQRCGKKRTEVNTKK